STGWAAGAPASPLWDRGYPRRAGGRPAGRPHGAGGEGGGAGAGRGRTRTRPPPPRPLFRYGTGDTRNSASSPDKYHERLTQEVQGRTLRGPAAGLLCAPRSGPAPAAHYRRRRKGRMAPTVNTRTTSQT